MNRFLVFFILLTSVLIAGCAQTSGTEMPEDPIKNQSYPVQTNDLEQPGYPQPEVQSPPTQTADASLAQVTGVLLERGNAVKDANLYLAELIVNENGEDAAFSFDRTASPRALTDDNGNFTFTNVKPGSYGIVIDLIIDSYLLLDPKSGNQFKITVASEKIVDLSVLDYDELPKGP